MSLDYSPNFQELWEKQGKGIYIGLPPPDPLSKIHASTRRPHSEKMMTDLREIHKIALFRVSKQGEIKKYIEQKDYAGLFDYLMKEGLSAFALDLAENLFPEKGQEVLDKFPELGDLV